MKFRRNKPKFITISNANYNLKHISCFWHSEGWTNVCCVGYSSTEADEFEDPDKKLYRKLCEASGVEEVADNG